MKKINVDGTDEFLYLETLPNKAKVYMFPMKERTHFTCFLGTYYGGEDTCFSVDGKEKVVPSGIAHFLEHKMFDQEINPSSFYAASGTDVNAQTTANYTGYYFSGNNHWHENLRFLLRWIKNFSITEDSVEKERGIILEEARMYEDNSNRLLYEKLNENVLQVHPLRQKVIGTKEDIQRITLEELKLCYESFYRPDNMFFILIGNFPMDESIAIMKEEWEDFQNPDTAVVKKTYQEVDEVAKKKEKIIMPIQEKKIGIAYKINKKLFRKLHLSSYELSYYLGLILAIGFGDTSDFYEDILKEQIVYSFQKRFYEIPSHFILEFLCRTKDEKRFYEELDGYLKKIVFTKEDFERTKKLWIATEVRALDSIQGMLYTILDDLLLEHQFHFEHIPDIKNLNYETLLKVFETISWEFSSIVEIENKK